MVRRVQPVNRRARDPHFRGARAYRHHDQAEFRNDKLAGAKAMERNANKTERGMRFVAVGDHGVFLNGVPAYRKRTEKEPRKTERLGMVRYLCNRDTLVPRGSAARWDTMSHVCHMCLKCVHGEE